MPCPMLLLNRSVTVSIVVRLRSRPASRTRTRPRGPCRTADRWPSRSCSGRRRSPPRRQAPSARTSSAGSSASLDVALAVLRRARPPSRSVRQKLPFAARPGPFFTSDGSVSASRRSARDARQVGLELERRASRVAGSCPLTSTLPSSCFVSVAPPADFTSTIVGNHPGRRDRLAGLLLLPLREPAPATPSPRTRPAPSTSGACSASNAGLRLSIALRVEVDVRLRCGPSW